jgi:membrane fusion protein (multidrug efflux system)
MKARQFVIIGIGMAILVVGKLTMNALAKPQERQVKKAGENVTTVFVDTVRNAAIPVYFESTGVLKALRRAELYSEVQGVMLADNGRFKAGNAFKKGEVLLAIRSNDQHAQLLSQRSAYESLITAVMADIKADFPEEYPRWTAFLQAIDVDKRMPDLPKVKSNKLKSFLVGKNVFGSYYALNNLEIGFEKYTVRAPYDGVLISVNIDPGTVIRQGQALGVFIQPYTYELEAATDAVAAERLKVGQEVMLSFNGLDEKTWVGKVARLVPAINPASQMGSFFVEISTNDLKEGMFLQAKVKAKEVPEAVELSRSVIVNDDQLYAVVKGQLELRTVVVEYTNENSVVVSGLPNGSVVLSKVPPSAFPGMNVNIYKAD